MDPVVLGNHCSGDEGTRHSANIQWTASRWATCRPGKMGKPKTRPTQRSPAGQGCCKATKTLKEPVKSFARGHPARGRGRRRLSPQESRQQGESCSQNTGSLSRLLEEQGGRWRAEGRCRRRRLVLGAWADHPADEGGQSTGPLRAGGRGLCAIGKTA